MSAAPFARVSAIFSAVLDSLYFWAWQCVVALDCLINAFVFRGWASETISSRAWRLRAHPFWGALRLLVDWLFSPFEQDHCLDSYRSVREGRQLPPEMRRIPKHRKRRYRQQEGGVTPGVYRAMAVTAKIFYAALAGRLLWQVWTFF